MIRLLSCVLTIGLISPVFAGEFSPKQIYRQAADAVVLVTAAEFKSRSHSIGTGAIIRKDGLVITNAHVVYNDELGRIYKKLNIYLKPPRVTGNIKRDATRKYKASIVHYSKPLDLAVLRISNIPAWLKLKTIEFNDSDEVEIGDPVVAIGHPEQGGLWTLTTGTISSQLDDFQEISGKNVFQTETSINKGNSGGPLIDANGYMVGINSNIARKGKSGTVITSINFSIKSNVARRWLKKVGFSFGSIANVARAPSNVPSKTSAPRIIPVPSKPKVAVAKPSNEIYKRTVEPRKVRKKPKPRSPIQSVEDEMEGMMNQMRKGSNKKTLFD
jgi:serine protease Do